MAVYGDRTRLREVFENLIDNAANYAGEQPDPRVEIATRADGSKTVIYVKDNGIGLALVKRIIETHGGNIRVESDGRGKGSTFCFTLPNGKTDDNPLRA